MLAATSPAAAQSPELRIRDARVAEGDGGTTTLLFEVSLSRPTLDIVSANYETLDGSARAGEGDYLPAAGLVTFAFGELNAAIEVTVNGDLELEPNETLRVRLTLPEGAALADSEAVGVIANDERTSFRLKGVGFPPYFEGTLSPAWGDPDADGWLDLPLYKGYAGAAFGEMHGFRAHLAGGNYHGGAWCDYDRNGLPDIVILPYEVQGGATSTLLLRNDGGGAFTNVTVEALGGAVQGYGETPAWADFDADGWPDLFASYYSHVAPFQSFFYRNNGDGTFEERSVAAGVDLPDIPISLRPEGAHAADWNGDGAIDLYCASHLFVNDGVGNFTDVRESVGLPITFDEGASFVDYDNDGDLDLYVRAPESPRLFRNDGAVFTEVTEAAGFEAIPFFWGDNWADVEHDGDLDLVQNVAGGPARLLLNDGDGTFVRDLSFEALDIRSALTAWGDVDRDGDLDFVVGSQEKYLYLNDLEFAGSRDLHLRVRVLDELGCESVHGSTVRLHALDDSAYPVQTRVIDGASGYLTQNEYDVSFGGIDDGRFALEVVYPSPAGSLVVVDSLTNSLLGPFSSATIGSRQVTVYRDGRVEFTTIPVVAVPLDPASVPAMALGQPVPSPARTEAVFAVTAPGSVAAELAIYDVLGRRVRRIAPMAASQGPRTIRWDLRNERGEPVRDGVYFARLSIDGHSAGQRRVVVMR
jgi:hypothetical protein